MTSAESAMNTPDQNTPARDLVFFITQIIPIIASTKARLSGRTSRNLSNGSGRNANTKGATSAVQFFLRRYARYPVVIHRRTNIKNATNLAHNNTLVPDAIQ